jgi:Domain of Unknown Function with PDB structure (DUF3862)
MSTQAYREIRQTGFFGKVVRLLFLVFNALMLIWLVSYWVTLSGQGVSTSAERTGAAIGGMIGSALLLFFWLAGAGIVGALALATRGPKLIIPIDTTSTPPSTRRKPVLLACAGFFVAFCVVAATLRSEKLPLTTEPPTAHTKGDKQTQPRQQSAQRTSCKVSLAQYQSLATGMSYTRVKGILGCEGSELSRVDMAGFTTVMYMWEGNSFAANMNVTFQNDALVSRAQFGLQ